MWLNKLSKRWLACGVAGTESSKPRRQTSRPRTLRMAVEQLEDRMVPTVVVGVSIDGMNTTNNSCNCEPPDTIAAAGPNHVIEMVNSAIEVFNKDGTVASPPSRRPASSARSLRAPSNPTHL